MSSLPNLNHPNHFELKAVLLITWVITLAFQKYQSSALSEFGFSGKKARPNTEILWEITLLNFHLDLFGFHLEPTQ